MPPALEHFVTDIFSAARDANPDQLRARQQHMLISCGGASSTGGRTGSGGTAATGGSSGIGGVSSTGGSRFLVVLVVPPEPPVELTWKPLLAPPVELDIAPPVPEVALEGGPGFERRL